MTVACHWKYFLKAKNSMQFARMFSIVSLLLIPGVNSLSQDQTKRDNANQSKNLPWVTKRIDAPRVSFHTFRSQAARSEVSYHVYTPPSYDASETTRFPVLYWLHGTEGGVNHVRPLARMFHFAIRDQEVPPLIVVFVNGLSKRLWTDSKDGLAPIETVFIEELIPQIDQSFRTIASREGRILEGFSMGGYGAARIGFRHTELFGGVSILAAGPLDLEFEGPRATGNPLREQILKEVCEGDMAYFKSTHPLTAAATNAEVLRNSRILIRHAVGSKDLSLALNQRFHEHLVKLEIPHDFFIVNEVGHDTLGLMAGLANAEFYRKVLTLKKPSGSSKN
jgi:enterochelin esterase-like enzyme